MDELEIYRRAFEAISEASFESAIRATLDAMVAGTGADRGFVVAPPGPDGQPPRVLAQTASQRKGLPEDGPSVAIVRRAAEGGRPVRIRNALQDPEFRDRPSVRKIAVLSVLAVPLMAGEEPLAVVYLDSVRVAGIFSAAAEQVAVRLAGVVAPAVRNARRLAEVMERESSLRARLDEVEGAPGLLGRSPAFQAAFDRALKAAASDAPILLEGESGTGKERFARAIHRASRRAARPFVAINCGAIPDGVLEAELFGHARGAFTGAIADREGRIEAAAGGTLFLDEVGDMPLALQVKLLRFLQSGEIHRLGESRERRVETRVLAATHCDLRALTATGRFREDLLYRLRVIAVQIPPLRDRGDDVVLLGEAFAQRFGRDQGKSIAGLSRAAREALLRHRFPGNVRELENAVRHAVVFAAGSRIEPHDLPPEVTAPPPSDPAPEGGAVAVAAPGGGTPRDAAELRAAKEGAVVAIERAFLADLLARAEGNIARAARLADMNRTVLHQMIARHEGLRP